MQKVQIYQLGKKLIGPTYVMNIGRYYNLRNPNKFLNYPGGIWAEPRWMSFLERKLPKLAPNLPQLPHHSVNPPLPSPLLGTLGSGSARRVHGARRAADRSAPPAAARLSFLPNGKWNCGPPADGAPARSRRARSRASDRGANRLRDGTAARAQPELWLRCALTGGDRPAPGIS